MKRARPPAGPAAPHRADPRAALTALRETLRSQAAAQAQAQVQAAARQREHEREAAELNAALRDVTPLPPSARAPLRARSTPPSATMPAAPSPRAVALSDELVDAHLWEDGQALPWHAPTVGRDLSRALQRGRWPPQATLDLHGLTVDQARDAVLGFLETSQLHALRCVRIVHGQGFGSAQQTPVLKVRVPSWLTQIPLVMAFCPAPEHLGGRGATLVLLRTAQAERS